MHVARNKGVCALHSPFTKAQIQRAGATHNPLDAHRSTVTEAHALPNHSPLPNSHSEDRGPVTGGVAAARGTHQSRRMGGHIAHAPTRTHSHHQQWAGVSPEGRVYPTKRVRAQGTASARSHRAHTTQRHLTRPHERRGFSLTCGCEEATQGGEGSKAAKGHRSRATHNHARQGTELSKRRAA